MPCVVCDQPLVMPVSTGIKGRIQQDGPHCHIGKEKLTLFFTAESTRQASKDDTKNLLSRFTLTLLLGTRDTQIDTLDWASRERREKFKDTKIMITLVRFLKEVMLGEI